MNANWLVARRLCYEKLNLMEQKKLQEEEVSQKRMLGSNEIIKIFFTKLNSLRNTNMPENTSDLFFQKMIPCSPKVTIETRRNGKLNIGGSDILQWFDSGSIVHVLHKWDEQLNIAQVNLWNAVVMSGKSKAAREED